MLPRAVRLAVALFLLGGVRSLAQDFTVTPVAWVYENDSPDVRPDPGRPEIAEVPGQVAKLDRPTYACVRVLIDVDGAAQSRRISSEMPWLEGPAGELFMRERHPKPAMRAGKPVASEVEYFLVFNPESAPAKGAKASARLLRPATVMLPAEGGPPRKGVFVEFEFSIDATGRATAIKPLRDGVGAAELAAARQSLPLWSFAPARSEGNPVASTVVVPVLFLPEPVQEGGVVDSPPQVIYRQRPVYPFKAKVQSVPGQVELSLLVDVEGRPRDIYVIESSHRIFERPAIVAVEGWRFHPALEGGVPVPMRVTQSFVFQVEGNELLRVNTEPEKLKKLPPELQWDQAPVYKYVSQAVYPFEALAAKKEGTVQLAFVVGPQGRVTEGKVVAASDPVFAGAALAMLGTFSLQPASRQGKPCSALLGLTVEFSLRGNTLVAVEPRTLDLVRRLGRERGSFARAQDLDRPLKPRRSPEVVFPLGVDRSQVGEALIEFIVDGEGVVHAPRAVSATTPAFGCAAVQSVARMRFAPPRKNGEPVDVVVRVPMTFQHRPAP